MKRPQNLGVSAWPRIWADSDTDGDGRAWVAAMGGFGCMNGRVSLVTRRVVRWLFGCSKTGRSAGRGKLFDMHDPNADGTSSLFGVFAPTTAMRVA